VDRISDVSFLTNLIKDTVKKGVIYHAINYLLSRCENQHITISKSDVCSICGKKIIDKYERVVGFLVPVKNWVKERREWDFPYRQRYTYENK
jgi:anaerobic ribonucleoside-triphosphate reductase